MPAVRARPHRRTPPAPPRAERPETQARLLAAAAEVFAERGYEHATVREMCRKAGANGAAVNYHYGSKERLYAETLRWAVHLQQGDEGGALSALAARDDLDPGERLEQVVAQFATSMLAPRPAWHRRLLLRELAAPSAFLSTLIQEAIAPTFAALSRVMAPFLPDADARTLRLTVMSIVGQVLYHRVAEPVALSLLGAPAYDATLVDSVAAHIARFTRRALEGPGRAAPTPAARARRARR